MQAKLNGHCIGMPEPEVLELCGRPLIERDDLDTKWLQFLESGVIVGKGKVLASFGSRLELDCPSGQITIGLGDNFAEVAERLHEADVPVLNQQERKRLIPPWHDLPANEVPTLRAFYIQASPEIGIRLEFQDERLREIKMVDQRFPKIKRQWFPKDF